MSPPRSRRTGTSYTKFGDLSKSGLRTHAPPTRLAQRRSVGGACVRRPFLGWFDRVACMCRTMEIGILVLDPRSRPLKSPEMSWPAPTKDATNARAPTEAGENQHQPNTETHPGPPTQDYRDHQNLDTEKTMQSPTSPSFNLLPRSPARRHTHTPRPDGRCGLDVSSRPLCTKKRGGQAAPFPIRPSV